jgi:hypothetical protein
MTNKILVNYITIFTRLNSLKLRLSLSRIAVCRAIVRNLSVIAPQKARTLRNGNEVCRLGILRLSFQDLSVAPRLVRINA